MASNDEDDDLGGLDARNEADRKILRSVLLINLDCGEVNALVDSHIAQVRAKMKELRELERELTDLRRSCDTARTSRECGILNSLTEPA